MLRELKFEKYINILDGKCQRSLINFRMCNNLLSGWLGQQYLNKKCILCLQ